MARWWDQPFRTFQTNLREIDAGLDVPAVLDHLESVGANTWLLNTGGIVSFYPSRLEFQHPSPWLESRASNDLIGDAVLAAHERGIRVVSRIDFSKLHADIAARHPDWCFADADGQPQIYNGLHSTCPSAPYYQERSFEIIGEILDNYTTDGFFFNWFGFNQYDYSRRYYGICQCAHCKERFKTRYGVDLPVREDWDDPAYHHWLDYTRWTLTDIAGRIRTFIKDKNPDVALMLHYNPDIVFYEANNAVDRPQPLWLYATGEFVRKSRTTTPDKPVWVNSVMFIDMPYRFVPEQPGMLGSYFVQTIANGGNPSAYMVGTPDLFSARDFEIVRDVFQFHRTHEDYYAGVRSAARVALVASRDSYEFYGGADGDRNVTAEFRGIYRALTEAHVPFDVLTAESLPELADADRYAALVLPNVAVLSRAELDAVDRYVADGGGLVATYETATVDADRNRLGGPALDSLGVAAITGRRTESQQTRGAYLRVDESTTLPNSAGGGFVPVDRAFLEVTPASSATGALYFLPPGRYGPPEKCYRDDDIPSDAPGVVRHAHGSGRATYFPWPIGALYHHLSLPEYRRLLVDAVREAVGTDVALGTNVPAQVEIVVGRQESTGRTLVHLINYSGHQERAMHDPLEIRDLRIGLGAYVDAEAARTARSLRLGIELSIDHSGDEPVVELPRLGRFDAIALE